ncbi:hypothetical protein KAR91_62560 [Candidatus Pacearchaeota archaeon]|nr:hypothetical protein [Candidatus Pacearchaeota archaeon]
MELTQRYKLALDRLASSTPMITTRDSGVSTSECKARVLFAKRILETANRNDAIEMGVIAEMNSQMKGSPIVNETLVGDKPTNPTKR